VSSILEFDGISLTVMDNVSQNQLNEVHRQPALTRLASPGPR
jgi:hypothetical protein